ncbi:MAG: L-seryl-tRNA(Sec) selenium transferase [Acidobacteriota bacterium]|nr:L-seryl-tRNA(Sec) selenium transferase [Acidobacteriota bacterium]
MRPGDGSPDGAAPDRMVLRRIPSVDAVLRDGAAVRLAEKYGSGAASDAVREALAGLRARIAGGDAPAEDAAFSPDAVASAAEGILVARRSPSLRPAINATGVVIHTGLGRAVLSEAAVEALRAVSAGCCNLAVDAESGKRGDRDAHTEDLLCRLTGAEAATVVNNNAAATVLILNTLAAGREVVVSRGQLVEIGGSFRMPDVMTASGAVLREVGTTNRTKLSDYEQAIGERTGALLRVHHSNYRIIGFTGEPGIGELVALGRKHGLPVVDDLGSGALVDLASFGISSEPLVRDSLTAGADAVCFSGDKLLGGPQCGIIAGREEAVRRIKKNPLKRAFRVGKLTIAALEATLKLFLDPETVARIHPVYRMLALKPADLVRRGRKLVRGVSARIDERVASAALEDGASEVGSGSVPAETLPTKLLTVRPRKTSAEDLARRLRRNDPPVFARIHRDAVLFDLRTIRPDEDAVVLQAVYRALET